MKITRFRGKSESMRIQSSVFSSLISHFDIRDEHKLIPHLGFTADEIHNGGDGADGQVRVTEFF